jgi:hypothetical protein
MEIHAVGAESFHTEGETDRTKPTVAFRNFTNAPKNRKYIIAYSCSTCLLPSAHKVVL